MYSIRECLELVGVLHSISDSNLEEKVLKIFEKVGHRLKRPADKQKKWNDNSEFFSPKDCQNVLHAKKELRELDLKEIAFLEDNCLLWTKVCAHIIVFYGQRLNVSIWCLCILQKLHC